MINIDTPTKTVTKTILMPKEEMLETGKKRAKFYIGIPKETCLQENRVALVPASVNLLVNNGHKIIVERDAGKASNFSDQEYSDAGAKIVESIKDIYEADIVLKISPPCPAEFELVKNKQIIFSALQYATQKKDFFIQLISRKVTALAFEFIKEEITDTFPIVRAMSEIAGNTAILVAAEYLSNVNQGKGLMLGGVAGVTPTEVVILGAGTVGEFAARSALGLGAVVKVFDNSLEKLRRLQNNLGSRIFTSILQPKVLLKALMRADVVIGTLRIYEREIPYIVSEEMVKQMKPGAVIIDLSIDSGGCFETSHLTDHTNPVYKKYDVIHYCVPNINSRVSRTASYALSNIFTPILLGIAANGGMNEALKIDSGLRKGVYILNGILTNKFVGETFDIPYKDVDLLVAAL